MTSITDQQATSNQRPPSAGYRPAKWGLGILVLAVFVFFSFFAKQFSATSLELDLKDKKVSINTKQLVVSPENINKRDPEQYYIDATRGFSFKKLVSQDWLGPQFFKSFEEFLTAKSMVMNPEQKERLLFMLQAHPLGPMLRAVEVLRYASAEQLNVETTDESTNPVVEEFINNAINSIQVQESSLEANDISAFKKRIRGKFVLFQSMKYANELTVYVYEKSKLKGIPVKHTLASFFLACVGSFAMMIDQLVANEHSIMAGASETMQNVKVNGKTGDVRVYRLWLATESRERYYVVEIGFSPQTQSSIKALRVIVWVDFDVFTGTAAYR